MNRISVEEYYMNIAIQVSLRSTCIRRRVGSVIVKDNRIISTGLPNPFNSNSAEADVPSERVTISNPTVSKDGTAN